jgi:hypothetical protein
MLSRVSVFCSFLFILSGCIYNDEPMPEITHNPMPEVALPPIIKPPKPVTKISENVPRGWLPPSRLENRKRWRGILIHHSGVPYGCAAHVHEFHKSLGWDGLGYHFVINNGIFRNGYGKSNGLVEVGYRWRGQKVGAHCHPKHDDSRYWNNHTIGICLIGNFERKRPTERQWRSLVRLVQFLQKRYNIPTSQVKGHRDIMPTECPGRYFSLGELRWRLTHHR